MEKEFSRESKFYGFSRKCVCEYVEKEGYNRFCGNRKIGLYVS